MKVIMIINSFHPLVGGAERQAQRISELLVKEGLVVEVLTRHHKGLEKTENLNGIIVNRFKVGRIKKLQPVLFLFKTLFFVHRHRKEVSVVHGHSLNAPGLIVALIKSLFGIPGIVKIAGGGNEDGCEIIRMNNKGVIGRLRVKYMIDKIDKFIAISNSIERDLKKVKVKKNKIVPLANGIDLQKFDINLKNEEKKNFLYLGRLEKVKGLDILIKAWESIIKNNPDFNHKLIIAGSGSLTSIIPNIPSIEYLGKIDNVKEEILKNKYFLLPSRYEGLSNALLEAMSLQRIVIASNVGGNVDLIQHGNTGFLFNSEDTIGLEKQILNVVNLKNSKDIAMNARGYLKSRYDLNENVQTLIKIYKELAHEKR